MVSPPSHLLAPSEFINQIPCVSKGRALEAEQQANACLPICSHSALAARGVYLQRVCRGCEQTEGKAASVELLRVDYVTRKNNPDPKKDICGRTPLVLSVTLHTLGSRDLCDCCGSSEASHSL